jgi:type II secretory pathway pseudopilin PulG
MKLHKTSKQRRSRTSGFTIADVVVAVLVLGIITGAFYTALSSSFTVLQGAREDLRATQIMMQRIEATRLCTWSELTNFTFKESYDPLSASAQTGGSVYYGSVAISAASSIPTSASYYPNMSLVTVNLAWTNSYRGATLAHSRQMQTYVARYGLQNYIWGAIP